MSLKVKNLNINGQDAEFITQVSGNINILNQADNEDLVNIDSVIKFKDKEYDPENYSGLGRVILRKNIVEIEDSVYGSVTKNILYQDMFNKSNTIYEIRYDFDLNGAEITIPEGCVLDFQGGSFKNAHLILLKNVSILNGNIEIKHEGKIVLNDGSKIKNCVFTNASYCFPGDGNLFGDNCRDIIIKDCQFAKQARQELGKCSSIDLRMCTNFVVDGITSEYTEGENIIIYEGSGVVTNCYCANGWSGIGTSIYGANVDTVATASESSQIVLSNNIIYNAIAAGISINNNGVLCTGNQILFENWSTYGPGIRLGHEHSNANNCVVSDNIIKWVNTKSTGSPTSNRGISLDAGNNNIIESNLIIDLPVGIGSSVSSKTGTIIANNIINNSSHNAISVFEPEGSNAEVKIYGNKVEGFTEYAISLTRVNASLHGNVLHSPISGSTGLLFQTSVNNTLVIANNDIVCDYAIGANIAGDITMSNNRIKSHTHSSIVVSGVLKLKDNVIDVLQIYPSEVSIIDGNIFTINDSTAMYIYACKSIVILNNIFNVARDNAYSLWWNVADKSTIEEVVIGGNYYTSVSLMPQSVYDDAGEKILGGYNYRTGSNNVSSFVTQRGQVNALGYSLYRLFGTTAYRPTLTEDDKGAVYFDTMLGKPIWWTGSIWIDANGNDVDTATVNEEV